MSFDKLKKLLLLPAYAVCLCLGACGTGRETCMFEIDPFDPLLPFPYEDAPDIPDTVLYESIQKLVEQANGPANSRFDYTRIDLDGDGRRDALVYLRMPYSHWCGQHGCTLLVLKAGMESFEYVSYVQPIRPPLIVSENRSNGWKDIMVRVDGRWSETKDVALKFDGRVYPSDPAEQPPVLEIASIDGIRVFP